MTKFRRLLVVGISLFLSFLLQFVLLPRVPFLIKVPNLLLCTVFVVGFLFGKTYGMITGLIAGYLLDVLGTGTVGFYILILIWIGYLNGLLSEKLESEVLYLLFLLFLVNEIIFHAYTLLLAFLIKKSFQLSTYLEGVFIPEVLLTFVCFIVYYGLMVYFTKRWDLRLNKGEIKIV